MNTRLYDFLRPIVGLYYRVFLGIRAVGRENIPSEGGFILCANHVHARDPFVIATLTRRHLHFMAKAELFKNRLVGWFIRSIGAFPIERGKSDIGAIRESLKILGEEHALGIFPQGTRSRENAHTHMESGVALIALRAGKPVLPVYVDGPYRPFRRTLVSFGQVMTFEDFGRKFDRETLNLATERIEAAIWSLQPHNSLNIH